MDQQELVERASQGDHEAFGLLVGVRLARLDTAARLILRDSELARDAVQEATLRAWRNLRGLRDPSRFDAWLHRLTVNACLDIARQRRSRVIEIELTPLHDAPVQDASSRVTDALYVERMLTVLSSPRTTTSPSAAIPAITAAIASRSSSPWSSPARAFPLAHQTFAGNTQDLQTVKHIVSAIETRFGKSQRVWVMDRGMISEESLAFLSEPGRRYLLVHANGTPLTNSRTN